ncbi:MAG: YceI family protein [Gammaproteobacteria bacterium]|nr:YceI family protein [Gammaproteobacteria bacterium]
MSHTFTKIALLSSLLLSPALSFADNYIIDTKGAHASVNFKIQHLGYSWLKGGFNQFSGEFSYDEKNPSAASVSVVIETNSVDSNHAERDKRLRSDDFLDVKKYPKATFKSTSFSEKGDGSAVLKGNFTLHGVTKPIEIAVTHVGHGADPWGGQRRGFEGTTQIALEDYGIMKNLGPKSKIVTLSLSLEGVKKR